jgi:hypothetical protein
MRPHGRISEEEPTPEAHQKKQATSVEAPIKLRRSVITTIRFRGLPLISFHKLIFVFLHSAPWFLGIPRRFSCFFLS